MKFSPLPRLYTNVKLTENKFLTLESDYKHYLTNVLRLKINDQFRIFNSIDGEFIAAILDVKKSYLSIQIISRLRQVANEPALTLGLCLIKSDKMLAAIDTAVQLGVTAIVPIIAERSQIRNINNERFSKCIIEATEQSERLNPPILFPVALLKDCPHMQNWGVIIYANENELANNSVRKIDLSAKNILFIVGPEGGFTQQELQLLSAWQNTHSISLGANVLRTETAVAAGLSQIQLIRHN